MKTILVTGGAGFIGSNFIRYMFEEEKDLMIVNADLLTYAGRLENLDDIPSDAKYVFRQGDIADEAFVNELFEAYRFDFVVNFAAESHVDNSIKNPGVFVKTNVLGTQNLLAAAQKSWEIGRDGDGYPKYTQGVKYIQISTDEVYGALGATGLFREDTPLSPNSPYSASKASGDMLVGAYHHTFKLPVNITRCSNNYGPYQFEEKLIPLMIMKALKNEKLPVYGDGLQIRDWLHVTDHCRAIKRVMDLGVPGEVYNIGGKNEKANIHIVKGILKALDKGEDLISYVQDRLGHDQRYAIDNSKIKTHLQWEPIYTFEDGLRETIDWYVEKYQE